MLIEIEIDLGLGRVESFYLFCCGCASFFLVLEESRHDSRGIVAGSTRSGAYGVEVAALYLRGWPLVLRPDWR